jgi:hypothetical protein
VFINGNYFLTVVADVNDITLWARHQISGKTQTGYRQIASKAERFDVVDFDLLIYTADVQLVIRHCQSSDVAVPRVTTYHESIGFIQLNNISQ